MIRRRWLLRLGSMHSPDTTAARQIALAGEGNRFVDRCDEFPNRNLRVTGPLGWHADLGPVDNGKADSRSVCMNLDGSPEAIVIGNGKRFVAKVGSPLNEFTRP